MRTLLAIFAGFTLACAAAPDKADDSPADEGNACEQAAEPILDRYDACGIAYEEDTGKVETDCNAEDAALLECVAPCIVAASCGVLDGSDKDYEGEAWTSYSDCLAGCML